MMITRRLFTGFASAWVAGTPFAAMAKAVGRGRGRGADFVLESLEWTADLGATWGQELVRQGDELLFRVEVLNDGNTGSAAIIEVDFSVDGVIIGSVEIGPFARGEKQIVQTADPYRASNAGTYAVAAMADRENHVGERREDNNRIATQLTVEGVDITAVDDTAATAVETPIIINVLANDHVTGDATLRLSSVQSPTDMNGTAEITPDGLAVLYTPAPGFQGDDRFTYEVVAT